MRGAAEPFPDLIEESLDEAAFLWGRWQSDLDSPTRSLAEVWSWTEDRLLGALDGVRVAGPALVDAARAALASDDRNRVAVGAGLLGSSPLRPAHDALAAALADAPDDRARTILRAVEVMGADASLPAVARATLGRGAGGIAALCRLKAFRRLAPGEELQAAFTSPHPAARAEAVRAAQHVASPVADEWIAAALRHPDPQVQLAAVESGMCRGMRDAWVDATHHARRLDPAAAPYLKLLGLFGGADEHEIVYAALRDAALQKPAIWALGHIGTARAAESCVAGMRYENLARACGEAYCWITGADLARDGLAQDEAVPEMPSLEDDDLDANLVPPPDEWWPLPDPEAVRHHWLSLRDYFPADVRHAHGRRATTDAIADLLESGPMLRRADLAFELRVRTRRRYDVETRALSARQRQMMTAGRAALAARED